MDRSRHEEIEETKLKMGMPHITSFFWCMGLETGARVVGFVHMVVSIILLIVCTIFASSAKENIGTVEDAGDHLYTIWYRIAIGIAVVSLVHIALALSLIISVYKRNTTGLRVWVYLMLVLFAAAILFVVISAAMHGMSGSGSDIFLSFLQGLVFFGILAYCILCVYSYYLMLKSSEDMAGPKTNY
ncbi:hypothetical protein K1T71_008086 [Dendrolimus kikuchii]|uniref:Uncharacterized protein n=1 Tax=Dendrolimus kikuchii TaxID=765133 RepID=A0ACC1CXR5_9NEOP|nr:hypothetical protein K1T71_008086 [Dendrolimus kikuchii]